MRWAALICAALAWLAASPAPVAAQRAYVANSAAGSVSIFETGSGASLGTIALGGEPSAIAITPDGGRAYVADAAADSVTAIDTASDTAIATVAVGAEPRALAIAPDGRSVWVANAAADTVSVIDTVSNATRGAPIAVGGEPEGIAVTPDGARVLVTQRGGGISVLAAASGAVIGSMPSALGPGALAIAPEGTRAYVANESSNSVSIYSLVTGTALGTPIPVGATPGGIAIAPAGPVLATSPAENTVTLIDPLTHTRIGPPLAGFAGPTGVATSADGSRAYVANAAAQSVAIVDTLGTALLGEIAVGAGPTAIALVPAQPPRAAIAAARAGKQGQLIGFDASASIDPDGRIATYSWDFGDGQGESGPSPVVEHRYSTPGRYLASLTVTDEQGCATALVFTGQTASCNGSPEARAAVLVTATDTTRPVFRLGGPRRQPLRRKPRLTARCPKEGCTARFEAVLLATGGERPAERNRLESRRLRLPQAALTRVGIALPRPALAAARHRLAAGGRVRLSVRAVARDAAGNESRRKLTVRLATTRRVQ